MHLWHGDDDAAVPLAHARALVARLPNAELRVHEGEGHFSVSLLRVDELLRVMATGA
jgi:fermentation-respiration switch protein FrsA (DUF1100 family)